MIENLGVPDTNDCLDCVLATPVTGGMGGDGRGLLRPPLAVEGNGGWGVKRK